MYCIHFSLYANSDLTVAFGEGEQIPNTFSLYRVSRSPIQWEDNSRTSDHLSREEKFITASGLLDVSPPSADAVYPGSL